MSLTDSLTFNNGATVTNRLVMPPMITFHANEDGTVSQTTLDYYGARSNVAGMIIVEACSVTETGKGVPFQIGVYDDKFIPGLKQLAQTLKKDGNKAIVQLQHAGRESGEAYKLFNEAHAPSAFDMEFLGYPVKELTNEQIESIIEDFGQATRRLMEAGFDGVEIHGANHYLLQQFFSEYSNRRTDNWGGSLEKRMKFPLAVVKEVCRVVEESGRKDFIIGYRISPEEIHEENFGYSYKESTQLIDAVLAYPLDYIHLSLMTQYDQKATNSDRTYSELFKEVIADRAKLIIVSNVFSQTDAEKALEYGDLVGIGRASLIDPEFGKKIIENRGDEIVSTLTQAQFDKAKWPPVLSQMYKSGNYPLPPMPGIETI